MTDSLKKKTVSSLIWNAIDKVGFQAIALIVGVITARILSPKDFGLIGALSIFILLSNMLIDSGFTAALIRRKNNLNSEYTAVFYFNLLASISIYIILYLFAPVIAKFFRMPELTNLSRFLFSIFIFYAFGAIQTTILSKELNFKLLTLANFISLIVSSAVAIYMAVNGYKYWAIAWQQVLLAVTRTACLWIFSKWRPTKVANYKIIKEIVNFGSIFILTQALGVLSKNIYNIIIGRIFNVDLLGYYTQAQKFQTIPTNVITSTLQGVSYPVLSKLNQEEDRQLIYFRKLMRIAAFLSFPILLGAYVMSEDLIELALTKKWLPAASYFRILLIAGITFPFHSLMMQLIIVQGKMKLYFILESFKSLVILFTLFALKIGIEAMLWSFVITSLISYFIDLYIIAKNTKYSIAMHLKDISPYLIISIIMATGIWTIDHFCNNIYYTLSIQILAGTCFYAITLKIAGSKIFEEMIALFKKPNPKS